MPVIAPEAIGQAPLWGGVLVGGASRRMGTPKHLVHWRGSTLLERVVAALRPTVDGVALLGRASTLPASCEALPAVADVVGAAGPLAGILAALRWGTERAWIVVPTDLPLLRPEACEWLRRQRNPGIVAVIPDAGSGPEPLLALYEPAARGLLELLAEDPSAGPSRLVGAVGVVVPRVPTALRACWTNVNPAGQLAGLESARTS